MSRNTLAGEITRQSRHSTRKTRHTVEVCLVAAIHPLRPWSFGSRHLTLDACATERAVAIACHPVRLMLIKASLDVTRKMNTFEAA